MVQVSGARFCVSLGLFREFRYTRQSRSRTWWDASVESGSLERTANIPTAMHRLLPRAVDNSREAQPPSPLPCPPPAAAGLPDGALPLQRHQGRVHPLLALVVALLEEGVKVG